MRSAVDSPRAAALHLLNANDPPLTRKAGQFLGQVAVESMSLTAAQAEWLDKLLVRVGVPPLTQGGGQ